MLKRLLETLATKKGLFLLSILLGVNLAFYFSAYLEDSPVFIPIGSTRMLAYSLFVSGAGTLLYFAGLLWAEKRFSAFSAVKHVALSFFLGAILFFTNTSLWLEPEFYVRSTLPISYELLVPWYASVGMAYFTGVVFYATLVYFLFALLLPKKEQILDTLERNMGVSLSKNAPSEFSIPDVWQKSDWFLIAGFVMLAFILRVINLEALPPHLEEYQHLIAAKQLLAGVTVDEVYQRGLYLVTMPVKLFFSLFGMQIWAARLPGVIVNSLALIPLYWLMRRYNKTVAIISVVLYVTSPWVIALSRTVREYAYHPLLYYLVLASALYLLENIPRGFLLAEWRSIFVKKNVWALTILAFFVLFVVLIDPFSSFKIIALLYLILGLFFVARLDFQDKNNRLILAIVVGAGIVVVGVFSALVLTNPTISEMVGNPFRALRVADPLRNFRNGNAKLLFGQFFFRPPTQWYYGRLLLFPLLSLFFSVWWAKRTRKQNPIPCFFVVLFGVSLAAFLLLYTYIYAPRFFLHIQLWYVPLLAIGVFGWYLVLKIVIKDKRIRYAFFALILLVTINARQLAVHFKNDALPVTYAIHIGFDELDSYMRQNVKPDDILLAKFYGRYVSFYDQPEFAKIYETSYDPALITENKSGWIVVDEVRYWSYRKDLLLENFSVDHVAIEYVGEFHDPTSGLSNFVWHWDKMP